MKIFIIVFILLTASLGALPPRADAFSECRSEKKGYCVRLDAQEAPKSITQKKSPLLFFAAIGAGPPFPGLEFLQTYGIGYDTKIGELLSALYNFGVVIAGISALIMFTYGGVRYLTSAGSSSAISDARQKMTNALIGLALIASSYLILYAINPDFTLTLSEDRIPSLGPKPKTVAPAISPPLDPLNL